MAIVVDECGGVFDRADIRKIERAERHRGNRKDDADALGAAKNLFLDRQIEWIEIDATRQQIPLPGYARTNFFVSGSATIPVEVAFAAVVKRFLTKQGKRA